MPGLAGWRGWKGTITFFCGLGKNGDVLLNRRSNSRNFPWDQPWEYAQEEGEIYDFDYRKIPKGTSGESAGPREPILNVGNGGQKAMNQTSDV
ncbi:hypothetical protein RUM43_004170 [Polyplax serrata]|uniref:Uncharacterized protein n=1 Tax=Polyplax serrata TaxID=468196 RepID=A0AAN8XKS1_POLSC